MVGSQPRAAGLHAGCAGGRNVDDHRGSGTGKSVTLKLMIGLLKPDRGEIYVDEQDITGMDEDELSEVQKKFSYVFQGGALFDSLTVGENVGFGLRQMQKHDRLTIDEIV